jgi:hypothetical protein
MVIVTYHLLLQDITVRVHYDTLLVVSWLYVAPSYGVLKWRLLCRLGCAVVGELRKHFLLMGSCPFFSHHEKLIAVNKSQLIGSRQICQAIKLKFGT